MIEENPYYSVKAISNSSLANINPEQGGSPQKYKQYIDGDLDKINSLSLDRGRLIHKWIEDKNSFEVSEIIEPPEMAVNWCKEVIRLTNEFNTASFDEVALPFNNIVLAARINVGVYSNLKKEEVILAKFNEFKEYYEFLQKPKENKITLTKQTRDILFACYSSLYSHPIANELLFQEKKDITVYNELAIYFDCENVPCKALLDRVEIDFKNKTIKIIDLKTTSKSVSLYYKAFIKWRTYRQLAFYGKAIISFLQDLGIDSPYKFNISYTIVAVETIAPFNTQVFNIDSLYTIKGTKEYTSLIKRIKWHILEDKWDMTKEEYDGKNNIVFNEIEFTINK